MMFLTSCGMFKIWDVWDVGLWGWVIYGDVRRGKVGRLGCGMFGMWDVQDVECCRFGMFGV